MLITVSEITREQEIKTSENKDVFLIFTDVWSVAQQFVLHL